MPAKTVAAFPLKHIRITRSLVIYLFISYMKPPVSCKIACKRKIFDTFRYLSRGELSMPIRPPYGRNFRAIS